MRKNYEPTVVSLFSYGFLSGFITAEKERSGGVHRGLEPGRQGGKEEHGQVCGYCIMVCGGWDFLFNIIKDRAS